MAEIPDRLSTNPLSQAITDSDKVIIHNDSNSTTEIGAFSAIKTWIEALTSYFNVSSDTSDAITEGSTNLFLTASERSAITTNTAKTGVTTEEANPDVVGQAEAEAGTATTERIWTAQRVAQAITALASGSGATQLSELSDVDSSVGSPSDGEIMVYRSSGSDWVLEAKPAAGSNPAAADISDATADGIALITSADANPFTDADETKLDGIEAAADVTDATNVAAAGAVMDTDFLTGTGVPSSTPTFEGQTYTDTSADISYVAVGTSSSADWQPKVVVTAGTPSKGSLLAGDGTDSFDEFTAGTNNQMVVYDSGETLGVKKTDLRTGFQIAIDGGGVALTAGSQFIFNNVPYDFTIDKMTITGDVSGSVVVDIWKDTYANYPATDADSITASAVPTLSSAQKGQDSTLSGWTTTVSAGDNLVFNVDSATTITRVYITLEGVRTF